ncbi:hypothetical protein KP509_17G046300 [Ceratopteris richardii]|uniref:DUF4378 domain-containing protein n=1 Tax=Ceratopteris richardii TaxID=49495 RepID=A0A8T2SZ15_CERRI|nr:hypothetical protein KP509_17G046300 [Ceratopteris richardii]
MASIPERTKNFYTNKRDYPGCMGKLIHFFDFNQVLSGRKLLTDKKLGAGPERPRRSLSLGASKAEVISRPHRKSNEELLECKQKKFSPSKKSTKIPIKNPFAKELRAESDINSRAPNVVTHLVGLEALPADSGKPHICRIPGKTDDRFTQGSLVHSKQRHEETSPHNIRLYAKKVKDPSSSAQLTPENKSWDCRLSSESQVESKSWNCRLSSESQAVYFNTQERQLHEFKREFEAWQFQRSESQRQKLTNLDDFQVHTDIQLGLPLEKPKYGKQAFSKGGALNQRIYKPDEGFHENHEVDDALDFLHLHKEFFDEFLQEPYSLFSRHMEERESRGTTPSKVMKETKHWLQKQRLSDFSETSSTYRTSGTFASKQNERIATREESMPLPETRYSPITRSSRGTCNAYSPYSRNEELVRCLGQRSHADPQLPSQKKPHNPDHHLPTRIVVLKPSSGRLKCPKSASVVYSKPPKDYSVSDAFQEDNSDVLERLREMLRRDSSRCKKSERKSRLLHLNEHYCDSLKDPKEIAREIARQVRENINRDFLVDFRNSDSRNVQSKHSVRSGGSRTAQVGGNDSVSSEYANRAYQHQYTSSSYTPSILDKNSESEDTCNSIDQRAHIIEHAEATSSLCEETHGRGSRLGVSAFDNDNHCMDNIQQFSLVLNSSPSSNLPEKFTVDACPSSEFFDGALSSEVNENEEDSGGEMDLGLGSKTCLETVQGTIIGGMIPLQLQSDTVTGFQAGEDSARLTFESGIPNKTIVNVGLNSVAASDDSKMFEDMDNGLKTELCQSPLRIEELEGLPIVDEGANVFSECKQEVDSEWQAGDLQLPASACQDALIKSSDCSAKSDPPCLNNFRVDKSSLNLKEESEAQAEHFLDSPQAPEIDKEPEVANDDTFHASVDDCESDHILFSTFESSLGGELTKEFIEQPSPVSVLDLHFQNDSLAVSEFKELNSDLEELQIDLHLINSDCGSQDIRNNDGFESESNAGHEQECLISQEDNAVCTVNDKNEACGGMCAETVDVQEDFEMRYVREIFLASGLYGSGSSAQPKWYMPGYPLDPALFQTLEDNFLRKNDIEEVRQTFSYLDIQRELWRRQLLFDLVNEFLVNILGPYLEGPSWLKPKIAPPMPCGKDLEEFACKHVSHSLCAQSGPQETLENLVKMDLRKGDRWLNSCAEMERTGLEVEKAIVDDLIEEMLLVL